MTDPLLVLAVDQRPWLTQALYGHTGTATVEERAAMCRGKHMVLDGLLQARETRDVPGAAILVDAELGPGVAERARAAGITVSMPLERAGREVYEDEPADLDAHLDHHRPHLAKVLVRYNPDGDAASNAVQRERLEHTAAAARRAGSRFLFELLVPATPSQLAEAGGPEQYDEHLRGGLVLRAMEELGRTIPVDVWKLEHLGSRQGYADAVSLAAAADGECILLGAGAPADVVDGWLTTAAQEGFSGFAIGRSIWWDALRGLLAGELSHADATTRVAEVYHHFVTTFETARISVAADEPARGGSGLP